jgi:chemotaxis signal transduction protein
MLRPSLVRRQQSAAPKACHLLIFSVGGRKLAVNTDEVASIAAWKGSIPVPSRTPFVSAVVRRETDVFPVFDLAELLHVRVQGGDLLCLTAKHPQGAMAICIDEDMPVLHTLDMSEIQAYQGGEFDAVGSFASGFDQIPIMSFAKLGLA